MIVGILKEIKIAENRVCMTPAGVEVMVHHKHQVLVETNAGKGSGFTDAEYVQAGATIVATAAEVFAKSDMVMHVKSRSPRNTPISKRTRSSSLICIWPPMSSRPGP